MDFTKSKVAQSQSLQKALSHYRKRCLNNEHISVIDKLKIN